MKINYISAMLMAGADNPLRCKGFLTLKMVKSCLTTRIFYGSSVCCIYRLCFWKVFNSFSWV